MDKKKVGNAGLVVLLVAVAAGIAYATVRPSRYREHFGGLLRIEQKTGQQEILVKGRWRPVPEFDPGKIQARLDTIVAEHLERQAVAPKIELPAVEPATLLPTVETK